MLPPPAAQHQQQRQRYTMRTVVAGGGSAVRVDVDLDATATTAPARPEDGPATATATATATPLPAAPRDRQRALLRHRTSVGPPHDSDVPGWGATVASVAKGSTKSGEGGGSSGGGGPNRTSFPVPSAKELLRKAEAKLSGRKSKHTMGQTQLRRQAFEESANSQRQQQDERTCRRISSRRSVPTKSASVPSPPLLLLPSAEGAIRSSSTSQPNLHRLTHHYAAQDPGFRKRFSDFVLDQLSTATGGGGDGGGDENNSDCVVAQRMRGVGSYASSLDQQRGYESSNDGGGEVVAETMRNGGYGLPAHRRKENMNTGTHHNHIQRIDQGQQLTHNNLPTNSHVTTIKLDNVLVQICNTQLTHFLRRERHYRWLSSFRRLDPRYQILTFFNDVSWEGGENVDRLHKLQSMRDLNPLLRGFVKASAFSVWRPTSNDAIYKMMRGEAVGKGLDVKGKSARRGVLSGYIPYVQIHDEDHKRRMRRPPRGGRVRVYYPSERARDAARKELTLFAAHASPAVTKARQVIEAGEDAVTEDLWERALKYEMILDVEDSGIYPLDDYTAQGRFGLDVPERYFLEVAIHSRDISRPAESDWDTGRNSEPAFQDMNNACVRAFDGEGNRAVILQMDDNADADPLQPQTLVIAYEEYGRVIPVCSDFDAFLVGTRAVNFNDPLPAEQVAMMADMIEDINDILFSPASMDSWTTRWLEVLKKKAGKCGDKKNVTPQYGYGDPKSYDMMEAVARRLEGTSGAVRHGPECFNLVFPQEIDDQFLVICDSLSGKVPWKYVDVHELQDILCERIDDGFAFPLNPQWVLCFPGWKRVWDKLMQSEDLLVQQSIDMWFPPLSGIRERVEEIHSHHPFGFQPGSPSNASLRSKVRRSIDHVRRSIDHSLNDNDNALELEGTEAMDLAEQELKYYMIKKRAKMKLRAALMFRKLRSPSAPRKVREAATSLPKEDDKLSQVCKAVSIFAGGW